MFNEIIKFVNIEFYSEEEMAYIDYLINNGLFKCVYGFNERYRDGFTSFVYKLENEEKLISKLKKFKLNYDIVSLEDMCSVIMDCQAMCLENIWTLEYHGNDNIQGFLKDEKEYWFAKDNQNEIYISNNPDEEIRKIITNMGRYLYENVVIESEFEEIGIIITEKEKERLISLLDTLEFEWN